MKIAVIGAGGKAGRKIAQEVDRRGWEVYSLVREPQEHEDLHGVVRACDAEDPRSVAEAVEDTDVVILAVGPKPGDTDSLAERTKNVLRGMKESQISKLFMVGGAGTLRTPSGSLLMETPQFPEAALPTAQAHQKALSVLSDESEINWVYISPAAKFLPEGEASGDYQLGKDDLLTDAEGQSQISYADYATALTDEIAQDRFARTRIAVAWN